MPSDRQSSIDEHADGQLDSGILSDQIILGIIKFMVYTGNPAVSWRFKMTLLPLLILLAAFQAASAHPIAARNLEEVAQTSTKFNTSDGISVEEITPAVFTFEKKRTPSALIVAPSSKPSEEVQAPIKASDKLIANIQTSRGLIWKKYIELKDKPASDPDAVEEKKYYEDKYKISQYKQLPFCVVVPSYNNVAQDRYLKNIRSILQQDYSNYRILFIDDGSTDNTGKKIEEYAKTHFISKEKLTIRRNEKQIMAMPNLHYAAHKFCKPYEIYLTVDGDDELIGKQVFKSFNAFFQEKQRWVIYTNFITSRGSIGFSRPYSQSTKTKNFYRKSGFIISHLRAFYTKLFQLIQDKDLKYSNGDWYKAANDVAIYIPAMEMSKEKVDYIPEISYLYNPSTGLNNHRIRLKEQKGNDRAIRSKPNYKPLETLFTEEEKKALEASMGAVIPMRQEGAPEKTHQTLEGWEK